MAAFLLIAAACSSSTPATEPAASAPDETASTAAPGSDGSITVLTTPPASTDNNDPTSSVAGTPSTAGTSPSTSANAAAEGVAENGFPVIAYFEATERLCIAHATEFGNQPPDHARFVNATVDSQLDEFRTVIVDGLGTRLVVDIKAQPPTVSLEDATAALPFDLSFGCPSALYVGFSND